MKTRIASVLSALVICGAVVGIAPAAEARVDSGWGCGGACRVVGR